MSFHFSLLRLALNTSEGILIPQMRQKVSLTPLGISISALHLLHLIIIGFIIT